MKLRIAETIKRLRTENGLTQNELASLLSVTPQSVSRWESGQVYPDIETLARIAQFFNVSFDELMGGAGYSHKQMETTYNMLNQKASEDPTMENEIQALDACEALARENAFSRRIFYTSLYFCRIMALKNKYKHWDVSEERKASARELMRKRMNESYEARVSLLPTIALHEDEDKLFLWDNERWAMDRNLNIWDMQLLERYYQRGEFEKREELKQRILSDNVLLNINLLSHYENKTVEEQSAEKCSFPKWFRHKEPHFYKTALDTINVYSSRFDDIFAIQRVMTEFRYAMSLIEHGRLDEGLDELDIVKEHLDWLWNLPDGTELFGSTPVLDKLRKAITKDDVFVGLVANIARYDRNPIYDSVRANPRFAEFFKHVSELLPDTRSFIMTENDNSFDPAEWQTVDEKAKMLAGDLSGESSVVALQSAKGNIYSITFPDLNSASDAEGAIKLFVEMEKNSDTKIARMICFLPKLSLDMPSYAFRDKLCRLNPANLDTKMLLMGLNSLIVKTVGACMPPKYGERLNNGTV
ncbi:MAG: helix-turn-helix transcriptional regulator [Clostridia bacterium]|nr:helix-turn-helix transcriptional regulator [Clostridia bacterium]